MNWTLRNFRTASCGNRTICCGNRTICCGNRTIYCGMRMVCCGLVFNCWLYGCQFDIKRPDHVACLYVHYAFTSYQPRWDSFNIKETSGTYMSLLFISIIVQTMLGTPCILKSYTSRALLDTDKKPLLSFSLGKDGHFGIKFVIFGRRQPKLAHFEK